MFSMSTTTQQQPKVVGQLSEGGCSAYVRFVGGLNTSIKPECARPSLHLDWGQPGS